FPFLPSSNVWERVGAERDACTHTRCPFYRDCFFFNARKEAEDADFLVVNHHLLMADLRAREAETTLLPEYDYLVIDEAHHLEDVATEALAWRASRKQLIRWLTLLAGEGILQGGKLASLAEKTDAMNLEDQELSIVLEIDLPSLKGQLVHAINE